MPRTNQSRGNWLHSIGNRAIRNGVNALTEHMTTAYDQVGQTVSNSVALVAETNLSVQVAGNTTYRIFGKLPVSIAAAANGIKLDFAAGSASIVAGTMGGSVRFGLTAVADVIVPITALNTSASGGTTNAWTEVNFDFTCQVASGGTIQLEFAQAAAGATNSTVSAGAYMVAQPLDHVVNT